jgi:hypothetical protein
VVNTWGAKGVFPWDSPYHFGTAGLQARDFSLAGLADVDVLVTSGLDRLEVTSEPWDGRAEVVDVAPGDLADAVARLTLPPGSLERPPLYTELASVVQPMYASDASPSPAAKHASELAAALPEGGLVVAAPGLVGFWVARTFPTSIAGSVVVPAVADPEVAHRRAVEVAATGRPVTLVAASPVELPGVRVEVWDSSTVDLDPSALVAVAGPIVAWGGVS